MRSAMKSSLACLSLSKKSSQLEGRGVKITRSPSLLINTSLPSKRNSAGSRTAWLRPLLKIFAVAERGMMGSPTWMMRGVYTMLYIRSSAAPAGDDIQHDGVDSQGASRGTWHVRARLPATAVAPRRAPTNDAPVSTILRSLIGDAGLPRRG